MNQARAVVNDDIARTIFDEAPNAGQGVYMSATAEQVTDRGAVEHGIGISSRVLARQTGEEFGLDRVTGDARLRLYRPHRSAGTPEPALASRRFSQSLAKPVQHRDKRLQLRAV